MEYKEDIKIETLNRYSKPFHGLFNGFGHQIFVKGTTVRPNDAGGSLVQVLGTPETHKNRE